MWNVILCTQMQLHKLYVTCLDFFMCADKSKSVKLFAFLFRLWICCEINNVNPEYSLFFAWNITAGFSLPQHFSWEAVLHDNQTSKLRADHETNHTVFVSHELKKHGCYIKYRCFVLCRAVWEFWCLIHYITLDPFLDKNSNWRNLQWGKV